MFSVMSLLWLVIQSNRQDIRIVIYTDRGDSAPSHPLIKIIEIKSDALKSYRGRYDYVHRIKHCVLLRASRELTGPILYVDCDTRWLSIPDEALTMLCSKNNASAPYCFMHMIDGKFSKTHFPDYHRYITECADELATQGIHHLDRLVNWNAGAIGLPAGQSMFFEDSLKMSDFLFTRVKPRNWVEQLAWSMIGCERYQMIALGDCFHHYWNHSYEAPIYLREFFDALPPNLTTEQLAEACGTHVWDAHKLVEIQRNPKHVWIRRWLKFKNSLKKRKIEKMIKNDIDQSNTFI